MSREDILAILERGRIEFAPRREARLLTLEFARVAANLLVAANISPRQFIRKKSTPVIEIKNRLFRRPLETEVGVIVEDEVVETGWGIDNTVQHSTDLVSTYRTLVLRPDGIMTVLDSSSSFMGPGGYYKREWADISEYPDSSPFPLEGYRSDDPLYQMPELEREKDVRQKLVDLVRRHEVEAIGFPEAP